jgi:uncharacterized membrane protein YkvA (DUF1232 family)
VLDAVKAVRFAALGAVWRALRAGSRPGTPGIGARLRALPRLVTATFLGRYRGTTRGRLVAMALGLVYVLSPIDLVPEVFVPLLGLVDDAFVVAWLAGSVLLETERYLEWETDRQPVVHGEVVH